MKTIAGQLNVKEFPFEIKDKRGNQIYFEDSNGFWGKYEYDSNGDEIYFENSNGFWGKYEYDSNSKVLYFEDSTGYCHKREYDSKGNQIYYEDSNDKIIDNRPKNSCNGKVVEIDGKKYKLTQL